MQRPIPRERLSSAALSETGFSTAEAKTAHERYGGNEVLPETKRGGLQILLDTIKDPMLAFLAITGIVYFFLGQRTDALALILSIFPLIGMDAFLHRRTAVSTAGLASRMAEHATVIRDGEERRVPALEVVPGDLLIARAGEHFAADGILIRADSLQVDESSLTGEPVPAYKRALRELPAGELPSVDDQHWGFAGTRILTGTAVVRVVFTGATTLYGDIARIANEERPQKTPLQHALSQLTAMLLGGAFALCVVLAGVRLFQGHGLADALVSAATLAVAAIPEEFPVALTFFLGTAVFRLARQRALVRRAIAVENVGRVSVICTDKTGTLTEGRLRVAELIAANGRSEDEVLRAAHRASRQEGADAVDSAILERANSLSPDTAERLATFPFTEDRRRETSLVREGVNLVAVTKGAPETVFGLCLPEEERARWEERVSALSARGYKVVAVAEGPARPTSTEPTEGFTLAGLVAFEDPVRAAVPDAITRCEALGIRPLMLTGDHPQTALAVARRIGLGGDTPRMVIGDELLAALERDPTAAARVDVVARATPRHKHAIVKALQAMGEVVAVTGDGVNDVPALQAADVGIAMGERGTRSAREAAAIVLLDDNFATLVAGVEEGRRVFESLRASFAYLLSIHLPLVLSAAAIPLFGLPLLFLPLHIVWLELIIHPTALLAFSDAQRSVSGKPLTQARFFNRAEWSAVLLSGGLATVGICALYLLANGTGGEGHARGMAMAVLPLWSAAIAVALGGFRSALARGVVLLSALSPVVVMNLPPAARLFHVSAPHLTDWVLVLGVVAISVLPLLPRRRGGGPRRPVAMDRLSPEVSVS